MKTLLARYISIFGHPLLLVPAAAVVGAVSRDANDEIMLLLVSVLLAMVAAILIISIWNVRSGRWMHIDANNPSERRSLNLFLSAGLLTVSAVTWFSDLPYELAVGFLVSGLVVVVALVFAPILKISLHTSFATTSTGLFWPNLWLILAGSFVIFALAWSRIILRRHTIREVILGCLLGAASAIGYHVLAG